MAHVNETWNAARQNVKNDLVFVMFDSKEELQETYWREPISVPLAVIFYTKDPVLDPVLEYVSKQFTKKTVQLKPNSI